MSYRATTFATALSMATSAFAGPCPLSDCAPDCLSLASTEADVRFNSGSASDRVFEDNATNSELEESLEQFRCLGDLSLVPRIESGSSGFLSPRSSCSGNKKWDSLSSRIIPQEPPLASRFSVQRLPSLSSTGDLDDSGLSSALNRSGFGLPNSARSRNSSSLSFWSSGWGSQLVPGTDLETIVIPPEDLMPRPRQSNASRSAVSELLSPIPTIQEEESPFESTTFRTAIEETQPAFDTTALWSERSDRENVSPKNAKLIPEFTFPQRGMGVDYDDVEGTKGHYPHRRALPARQVLEQLDRLERQGKSTPRSPNALRITERK